MDELQQAREIADGLFPPYFGDRHIDTRNPENKAAEKGALAALRSRPMTGVREALAGLIEFIEKTLTAETIGEGVHAGLRKGTEAADSHELWRAIADSNTTAWGDACRFAVDPFFSMWGKKPLANAKAALASLDNPSAEVNALGQRTIDLVIASRAAVFGGHIADPEARSILDKASEAFAADVPWEDEPDGEE
ncbi:MAG TPA: hypothetical protein VF389_11585 [Woeseiaceae bacterium]